jgi:uncharacterized protein (TIGR02246 family)
MESIIDHQHLSPVSEEHVFDSEIVEHSLSPLGYQLNQVIIKMEQAWNDMDIAQYGSCFAMDAELIDLHGRHYKGRNEIIKYLKDNATYKFTQLKYDRIKHLGGNKSKVMTTIAKWEILNTKTKGITEGIMTIVFCWNESSHKWFIALLQNTSVHTNSTPSATTP